LIASRRGPLTAGCLAFGVIAGCGSAAGPRAAWRDPIPLPIDTMVMGVPEIGVHGGRFVMAEGGDPRTFNTMMSNEQYTNDVNNLLWASLVDYDYERDRPMPALARSWEISSDGTRYTWHLRRGARFSDGTPITSADVLFSAEVAYDSTLHPVVQDLVKVEGHPMEFSAPDSYTVVTRVARPYGQTVWAMSSLRVLPRHRMEAAYRAGRFASAYGVSTPPESVVTSGAWRLQKFVAGEKTVVERNPYWFRVDPRGSRLPYLDQVVFLVVPDQTTAALKFEAGEVDAVDNIMPQDYARFEAEQSAKDFTFYDVGPSLSTNFLWFNCNRVRTPTAGRKIGDPWVSGEKFAWFDDPVFRRAVSMAIDRDHLIRGPFFGFAVRNWSTATPGNRRWHSSLVGADYNPAKARALLASLGWRDRDGDGILEDRDGHPVRFSLQTNADNEARKAMANAIAEDLRKVGIEVTPVPVQFNALITSLRSSFDYDAILLGLGSGVPPDPGQSRNVYHSSGVTHFWNERQPRPATPAEAELDSLIDLLSRSSDDAVRHRSWLEMQRIMLDQNFFVWLPTQIVRIPVRNRFGNVRPQVVPNRVLWNIERVFERHAARPL
jgi:peptide/nickel transport system substrate-binding protein